jgi:ketosteroid isomerase-like protein
MQPTTSISRENSRAAHGLSRRGFLTVALAALAGLSLTLVGCSPDDSSIQGVDGNMAVVDDWIKAINAEDAAQFEKLHTETTAFHPYIQSSSPSSGRQNVWDAFSHSYAPLQKIYMLGQDDFVCLQVTAAEPKRSFLYVFRFEGDLIAQVHEYSAIYDLSDVPLFDGAEITTNDAGLAERIDTVDSQVEALNERDLTRFMETFSEDAIQYGPMDGDPYSGAESIRNDLEAFLRGFPHVEMSPYQTFGQGNLVCQQVAVENAGIKSLGHLFVFEDGKVAQTYQYVSNAELTE